MQPDVIPLLVKFIRNDVCNEYSNYGEFFCSRDVIYWKFNSATYKVCVVNDYLALTGSLSDLIKDVLKFKKITMAQAILFSLLDKLEIPND